MESSLTQALRLATPRIPITEMDALGKGELLVSILLGFPPIAGEWRPRDLPLHPHGLVMLHLAHRIGRLVLPVSGMLSTWVPRALEGHGLDAPENHVFFSDFAAELALRLRSLPRSSVDDRRGADFHWNAGAQLLLAILGRTDESWGRDASFAHSLLDFSRSLKNPINDLEHKEAYQGVHQLVLAVGRRDGDLPCDLVGFKLLDINRSFIQRFQTPFIKSGASGLVEECIFVLREHFLKIYGPGALVHDCAGSIHLCLPPGTPADIPICRHLLAQSLAKEGSLGKRYPTSIPHINELDDPLPWVFPQLVRQYHEEVKRHSDLAHWKAPSETPTPGNPRSFEIIRSEIPCTACGQFKAVAVHPRWKPDPDPTKSLQVFGLCPACHLAAGVAADRFHRFSSHVLHWAHAQGKPVLDIPQGRDRTAHIAHGGQLVFFFADGDGVGGLVKSCRGVGALRRLSLALQFDLLQRLNEAVQSCLDEVAEQTEGYLGLELVWMGGDDLMLRFHPSAELSFRSAFAPKGGDLLSYTCATVASLPTKQAMMEAGHLVRARMKELKQDRALQAPP